MATVGQARIESAPASSPWASIIPVWIFLGGFGIYATLRAFEGAYYEWGPYLSPFYSPLIDPHHHWWPLSPAVLILGGPLSFRMTCYYYRKAYYRAFFFDPPGCAVPERSTRRYSGETRFPFILQNAHRYTMYIAIVFLGFLWRDAIRAFRFPDGIGMGVGTIVLLVNVILLSLYLLSCHSVRHLIGGKLDCYSCAKFGMVRHKGWRRITSLNEHHMLLAWISLCTVGFADFYIRLVSSGAIRDIRIF